jgi:DNA-binding ferritin-like protein (Dps family)
MVKGLEAFRKHFEAHAGRYILIGGTACDVRFAEKALEFRRTKDLDIILVVEALTDDFVRHFWEFIRRGGYAVAEVDAHKRFYRFISPKNSEYPAMLELFSRHPDVLELAEGLHITDIPTGEDVSSLSAILMDDHYYHFTLANSNMSSGLHVASDVALIALKAKAFLNNRRRKEEGQSVQEVDIAKHRNDVVRLAATVEGTKVQQVPDVIREDVATFIRIFTDEPDNIKALLKPWGMGRIQKEDIIAQLLDLFEIYRPTGEVAEATVA